MIINHQRMNRSVSLLAAIVGIFTIISSLIGWLQSAAKLILSLEGLSNYSLLSKLNTLAPVILPLCTAFTLLLAAVALFINRKNIVSAILFVFSILSTLLLQIPVTLIQIILYYKEHISRYDLTELLLELIPDIVYIVSTLIPVVFFALLVICCFSKGKLFRGKLSLLIGVAALLTILAPVLTQYTYTIFYSIIPSLENEYDILRVLAGYYNYNTLDLTTVLNMVFIGLTAAAFMAPQCEKESIPTKI